MTTLLDMIIDEATTGEMMPGQPYLNYELDYETGPFKFFNAAEFDDLHAIDEMPVDDGLAIEGMLDEEVEHETVGTISPSDYIKWVQRSLNRLYGTNIPANGVDSTEYRAALRRFNQDYLFRDSDTIDERTQNELMVVNKLHEGYVRWVILALNVAGLGPLPYTDTYTTAVTYAIKALQKRVGLKVDGFVGAKTELALIRAVGKEPPGTVTRKTKLDKPNTGPGVSPIQPPIDPNLPNQPSSPPHANFLPKARFPTLAAARYKVREDLWIQGEASGLLGGPDRTYEWTWAIFKVVEQGKSNRYGYTRLHAGERRHTHLDVKTNFLLRRELGLSHNDERVHLIELGHTHPSGPRASMEALPEQLSGIHFSSAICKDSMLPCGDKAFILETGLPLSLITPKGRIVIGRSRFEHPLGNYLPKNKMFWKEGNVRVHPFSNGICGSKRNKRCSGEWRPSSARLKERIESRVLAIAKQRGVSQRILDRALRQLKRKAKQRIYG